ncbi:MAG: hypothetical protein CMQ38_12015, partial [Gammaproteobacteria bacterium]|nr:hypothetical protein [Gammaproteobacteria bacterium]
MDRFKNKIQCLNKINKTGRLLVEDFQIYFVYIMWEGSVLIAVRQLLGAILLVTVFSKGSFASEGPLAFSVSAQSANAALLEFAQQAGMSILFPSETFAGISVNTVNGEYSVEEALEILLQGTGIEATVVNEFTQIVLSRSSDDESEINSEELLLTDNQGRLNEVTNLNNVSIGSRRRQIETEEVIITAERREATEQTTSISMEVFTGEDLAANQVQTLDDLQNAMPGVQVQSIGPQNWINIRGIGNSQGTPDAQMGVSVIQDGFTRGSPMGLNSAFFDINTIEVLRGPQGTFVGQSSAGGAIIINSANPDFDGVHGSCTTLKASTHQYRWNGCRHVSYRPSASAGHPCP